MSAGAGPIAVLTALEPAAAAGPVLPSSISLRLPSCDLHSVLGMSRRLVGCKRYRTCGRVRFANRGVKAKGAADIANGHNLRFK